VLRVAPQRGDRVAVEVPHHLTRGPEGTDAAGRAAPGVLRKQIRLAAVVRFLLGGVGVILIRGIRLRSVEAKRLGGAAAVGLGRIGIAGQKMRRRQVVHPRRVRGGGERGLAGRIRRPRIGGEVVIEGDVLVEDDDEVLDRRGGLQRLGGGLCGDGPSRRQCCDAREGGSAEKPAMGSGHDVPPV